MIVEAKNQIFPFMYFLSKEKPIYFIITKNKLNAIALRLISQRYGIAVKQKCGTRTQAFESDRRRAARRRQFQFQPYGILIQSS
jgi:hypothetical protein